MNNSLYMHLGNGKDKRSDSYNNNKNHNNNWQVFVEYSAMWYYVENF